MIRRAVIIVIVAAVVFGSVYLIVGNNSTTTTTTTTTSTSTTTTIPHTAKETAQQTHANFLAQRAGCSALPATATDPANTLQFHSQPKMALKANTTYYATIVTTQGTIRIRLAASTAPINVNNFVFLAQHGYYTCNNFHRVIPGFMNQTGDPTGTGGGSPGFTASANEFPPAAASLTAIQYPAGTVAMANSCPSTAATPAQCGLTNGGQFFIVAKNLTQETLPPRYTIIGRVVSGMGAVLRINATGDAADDGTPPFVINRILKVTITP